MENKKSNTGDDGHHRPLREYFVTQTVSEHLEAFANIGLEVPDALLVEDVERELILSLKDVLGKDGDVALTVIPVREQCHAITSSVNRLKKRMHNPLVVSTCPLLSFGTDGRLLHLSRLIDDTGKIIAIGPRPCHDLPSQQVADILRNRVDREVILVEDGAFTGGTVAHTLELFQKCHARVEAIVLGILFPEAEAKIRKVFSGELVSCQRPADPLDWMPSHDFFPFLPSAGRVVGYKFGDAAMPAYLNYEGAAIAVPYILPYGKPEWASLPRDQHALNRFCLSCLQSAVALFKNMGQKHGQDIRVGDVVSSNPPAYVPVSCGGQASFAREEDEVVRTLELDMELLS